MLRRNSKRLCKFAVCLATVAFVCYMLGKCEDFVPILLRKIDGFSKEVNQLVPRMHTMLKSGLNDTTGGTSWNKNRQAFESGSQSNRNDEILATSRHEYNETVAEPARTRQNKQREQQRIGFSISQSDLIKVFDKFAQRQSDEAELRLNQFQKVLKNLTRTLMKVAEKGQKDSFAAGGHRQEDKHGESLLPKNRIYPREENENLITKTKKKEKENTTDKIDLAVQKDFSHFTELKPSMPSEKVRISSTMAVDKLPTNLLKTEMPKTRSNGVTFRSAKEYIRAITTPRKKHPVITTLSFTNAAWRQNKGGQKLVGNIPKNFTVRNKIILSTTRNSGNSFKPSEMTNFRGNFSIEVKTEIPLAFRQKPTSKFLNKQANMTVTVKSTGIMNIASFKQQEKRFRNEIILNRRAESFLRKIKDFGMTYSERLFLYKRQKNATIFYREVLPVWRSRDMLTIFLLHDLEHDSRIWLSTGTFYSLGKQGHRVIALDLPGYGKSMNISKPGTSLERLKLLASFMFAVTPKGPRVLVSTGESGLYSVPIVMSASVMLKGVVFVSTAYTGKFPASKYENVHLPALVIHGENNTSEFLREFSKSMNHLPDSERIHSFEDCGRYCYIGRSDDFHELLNKFLLNISLQMMKSFSNKSRLRRS